MACTGTLSSTRLCVERVPPGGAELFGAFLDAGQVDELVLHVIPTLIGRGIPVFSPRRRTVPLTLQGVRKWPDGVVPLRYALRRSSK